MKFTKTSQKSKLTMIFIGSFLFLVCFLGLNSQEIQRQRHFIGAKRNKIQPIISKLHLPFIVNQGQINEKVTFYANVFGGTVFLTKDFKIIYTFSKVEGQGNENEKEVKKTCTIIEELLGEIIKEAKGEEKSITKVSIFKGKNSSDWLSHIPTYNIIDLGEVYEGIDLMLKIKGNNLEKIFLVKPKVNPANIKIKVSGIHHLKVSKTGELLLFSNAGVITLTKPVAYQEEEDGTKKYIDAAYILNGNTYGFNLEGYDRTRPLIIDPLLSYKSLGGNSSETGWSVAVDKNGNVYISGTTNSSNFPTTSNVFKTTPGGRKDIFVTKLDNNLNTIFASALIGGFADEETYSMVLDDKGNVYLSGFTASDNFPTTEDAYANSHNGGKDIFVMKLDENLKTIAASTRIGGSENDECYSIKLDENGNIYIGGGTRSANFPTTNGAYDNSYNGEGDVFISKLDSDLKSLSASTYIGGIKPDGLEITGIISIDGKGNIFVTGNTSSPDFPTTPNAYCRSFKGRFNAFLSRLDKNLSTLSASTYLGGNGMDWGYGIDIDKHGMVYLIGHTSSPDLPVTPGAYDRTFNGDGDVFISKFDNLLTKLFALTYLGGSDNEFGKSITLDKNGNIYAAGFTKSPNFPFSPGAYDETFNGNKDVFISRFDKNLKRLSYSTFFGGSHDDYSPSFTPDEKGNIYVTGYTKSSKFSTKAPAKKNMDAFIAKFDRQLFSQKD